MLQTEAFPACCKDCHRYQLEDSNRTLYVDAEPPTPALSSNEYLLDRPPEVEAGRQRQKHGYPGPSQNTSAEVAARKTNMKCSDIAQKRLATRPHAENFSRILIHACNATWQHYL